MISSLARTHSTSWAALALCVVLTVGGCSSGEGSSRASEGALVIRGGGLFDGTGDAVVPNPGIVIEDGRFVAIDAAAVLRFATINAARALKVDDELGTIEAGKLADLVILEGNPLEDIRNTRHVRMVAKEGIFYDPHELLSSVKGKIGPTGPQDLVNW